MIVGTAVGQRDVGGRPIGDGEEPLRLGGTSGHRSDPARVDGQGREPAEVRVAEPRQPLLEGLHPAVVMRREAKLIDQSGDDLRLAGGLRIPQGGLALIVGQAPPHRPAVDLACCAGLTAIELVPQQLAEEVVIAIPLSVLVERHHELVGPFERLEHGGGMIGFEGDIAQRATHRFEHRRPHEELGLLRPQARQDLEPEVGRHHLVVSAEPFDTGVAGDAAAHRQGSQVDPGGPALRALVQLRDLIFGKDDVSTAQRRGRLLIVQSNSEASTSSSIPCARQRAIGSAGSARLVTTTPAGHTRRATRGR